VNPVYIFIASRTSISGDLSVDAWLRAKQLEEHRWRSVASPLSLFLLENVKDI
jgi:hypothetical protein